MTNIAKLIVSLLFILFLSSFCTGTRYVMMQVTDVHGWIDGHPHNSTLNADFGDFCSLVYHMNQLAKQENYEFLLFDSGDLIEGTGLSDATPIHGQYIFPVASKIKNYTALTMGNHDIGHESTVQLMEETFIPHYNNNPSEQGGRYLTANIHKRRSDEFIGEPYSLYHTRFGDKLLLLGWLYNFTQEAKNTRVDVVSFALQQPWFIEAMNIENIDMIICTMHIDPTSEPELQQIYAAIRKYHPDTPLVLFSGHRHILYYEQLDTNCFTFESGKYFEVIGLVEFDLQDKQFTNFSYQWIDTSLDNFYELSQTTPATFLTKEGQELKDLIDYYTNVLHLNDTLGCSLTTYDPSKPIVEPTSLYNFYLEHVIPSMIFNKSLENTQYFISNTGTLRYVLYEGRVDVNDIFSISPFSDVFVYFQNLQGSQLQELVQTLIRHPIDLLQHTPYFGTYEKLDYKRPGFTHSLTKINPNAYYDVVCASYDSTTIAATLNELFPSQTFTFQPYPTTETSTSALGGYIVKYMPCTSQCVC